MLIHFQLIQCIPSVRGPPSIGQLDTGRDSIEPVKDADLKLIYSGVDIPRDKDGIFIYNIAGKPFFDICSGGQDNFLIPVDQPECQAYNSRSRGPLPYFPTMTEKKIFRYAVTVAG